MAALLAGLACGFVLPGQLVPHKTPQSVPRMVDVPPEFVEAAAEMAGAEAGLDAAFGVGLIISAGVVSSLLKQGEEDGSAPSQPQVSKERGTKQEFGWLHADHRIPLPSLAELELGCHLIGEYDGREMFLCRATQLDEHKDCLVNSDFSAFYGEDVFVCKGGPAQPRFKEGLPSA